MVLRFGQLFDQSSQKVAHFVRKHEKSSILPKVASLGRNYHSFVFWVTLRPKVALSWSFREKARKIIDLAKTRNSSHKLSWFSVLGNFWSKSSKKWLIS